MLVESPGAYLHARRATGTDLVRFGAASAAAALLLASSGDALVAAVLLGVAAYDATSAGLAGAAMAAVLVRWGSSSLVAIAGAQAVLGPAIAVGPPAAAISTGAAAVALVLAAQPGPTAVPFGLAAGVVLAGPAASTPGRLAVRVAVALACALVTLLLAQRVPVARRQRLGMAAAAVAVAAALLA